MVNEEALIARAKQPHFGSCIKRRRFFGKQADLGCLYDAKTDRYISFSLFKHNPCLLPSLVKTNEKAVSNVSGALFGRTYDTRLEFLGLQTELKTSALVKMVDSDGCLKIIDTDESDDSVGLEQVQGVLFQETSSREEELNLENDLRTTKKKSLISSKDINAAIKNKLATHVVVGIRWGVSILVNFSSSSSQQHQEQVSKVLARIWPCVENHTKFWPTPDEEQTLSGLRFKVYTNNNNATYHSPDNIDSLIELLATLPAKLAQDNNQGRGFPIELELMPVHEFKKLFAIPGGAEKPSSGGCACCASGKKNKPGDKYKHKAPDHYEELSYDLTYHIDKVFEKYLETYKRLTDVSSSSLSTSSETRASIEEKKKELRDGLAILRRDLSPLLVKLRAGEHERLKEVHSLLERYENNSYYSPQAVTRAIVDDEKKHVRLIGGGGGNRDDDDDVDERKVSIRDKQQTAARMRLSRLTKSNSNLSSVLKAEENLDQIQADKEFIVLNAVNGGCLDGGPLSHVWHGMDAVEQTKYLVEYVLWRFVPYNNNNTYLVQSVQHDGYLSSDSAHLWYGTPDESPTGVDGLLWQVVSGTDNDNGFYLRSVRTGAYLDGQSSGHLWTSSIAEAQQSDRACIEWQLLAPSRNKKLVLAKKN